MLDGITQGISNVIESIKTSVNDIKSAIGKVVTDLITSLTDLLKSLFIPSEDYFKDKMDDLIDKFSFVESIVGTISVITDFFDNTDFSQPPKVTISLDLNKSKYFYGTKAIAIDFSFYEDYKPTVDFVLSAIIYIRFAWAVFKDLPNIMQGVGGRYETSELNEINVGSDYGDNSKFLGGDNRQLSSSGYKRLGGG